MVEEVACALLDATRRMSISGRREDDHLHVNSARAGLQRSDDKPIPTLSSSVGSGGFWGSWNSSTSELGDKTGSLPKNDAGSWFDAMRRDRTMSESESGKMKLSVMAWLTNGQRGAGFTNKKVQNLAESELGHSRIRRSSSRDIEEAMAGGFNKASIYMPPI